VSRALPNAKNPHKHMGDVPSSTNAVGILDTPSRTENVGRPKIFVQDHTNIYYSSKAKSSAFDASHFSSFFGSDKR
jgi:hypothetical protein